MASPNVVSVSPLNLATDVVLGISVVITFDSLMDHTSFTPGSFGITFAGSTEIFSPQEQIQQMPVPVRGVNSVAGTWTFDETTGVTIATFTPKGSLQQNTAYKVTLIGAGAIVATPVKDTLGNALTTSYGWTFTTGTLNLSVPPVQSPILVANPNLDPTTIAVLPRKVSPIGEDLTQQIVLSFPDVIDQTSFDPQALWLSVEPILGDPNIIIPPNLQTSVAIQGKTITITITGWPTT